MSLSVNSCDLKQFPVQETSDRQAIYILEIPDNSEAISKCNWWIFDFFWEFLGPSWIFIQNFRYNDKDWSLHCKSNHGNQRTCNKILEIMHDASRMGTFFVEYLRKVKRDKNIDIMYIAAPPDEMDMLNRVKIEIMKMLPTAEIYLSTQVKMNWIYLE